MLPLPEDLATTSRHEPSRTIEPDPEVAAFMLSHSTSALMEPEPETLTASWSPQMIPFARPLPLPLMDILALPPTCASSMANPPLPEEERVREAQRRSPTCSLPLPEDFASNEEVSSSSRNTCPLPPTCTASREGEYRHSENEVMIPSFAKAEPQDALYDIGLEGAYKFLFSFHEDSGLVRLFVIYVERAGGSE